MVLYTISEDLFKKLNISTSITNFIIAATFHSLLYCAAILLAVNRKQLRYILLYAVAVAVAVVYPILGMYLGWRARRKEESQLLFLRDWSLDMACSYGTEFGSATLEYVDFSGANLKYARFKGAKK